MLLKLIHDTKFRALVISISWVVWWILTFIQNYFLAAPGTLQESIIRFTVVGIIWGLETPLVLYFCKHIPYNNNFVKLLILHILGATVIMLTRNVLQTFIYLEILHQEITFVDLLLRIIASSLVGNYIIYGFIASLYYMAIWFSGYRDSELKRLTLELKSEQLEKQLSVANLTALRMQLNPHFLFNTLNSVASLIRIRKNNDAIETLSTLSELLRSTVYEGTKSEVTIHEEITFMKRYLSIEQLRFSDRLEVAWEVDATILEHRIPNFLLQPLVENALKHGLKETQHGKLSISIKSTQNGRIEFLIEDNGSGLAESALEKTSGVGIKNTVNRLKGTYNDRYEFYLSNNSKTAGTQVKLVLPVQN